MFSLQLVQATLDKYGLHFDAKKVLRKISGKRPGKHCVGKSGKGSYISAEKKCASHKTADGKLTEAGRASSKELAGKVRKRKGMRDRNVVKNEKQKNKQNPEAQIAPITMEYPGGRRGSKPWVAHIPGTVDAKYGITRDFVEASNVEWGKKLGRVVSATFDLKKPGYYIDSDGDYFKISADPKTGKLETEGSSKVEVDGFIKKTQSEAKKVSDVSYGTLYGSDKQVSWATGLRDKALGDIFSEVEKMPESPDKKEVVEALNAFTKSKNQSRDWIDNRSDLRGWLKRGAASMLKTDSAYHLDSHEIARYTRAIDRLNDRYGLHLDAKKVLLKMGGRRPGKRCKNGWIAAEKQCSDHKTSDGKLTAAGKSSASELADKVRKRKGMEPKQSIAQSKLSAARNKENSEYWRFSRSQSQNLGPGAMAQAGAELAKVETQSGKARIWNKPFNDQSMRIFGYAGQDVHRKQVEKAIKRGESVPKDVLDQYPEFTSLTRDKPDPTTKKNANSMQSIVKEIASNETATLKKQLVGLDDRIEVAQKTGTARKTAATKARKQNIPPSQLNASDRKQAVQYNEQGAARAKSEGRSADVPAWQREAKQARISNVKSAQRQANTTQSELFGIEEVTDLPLFRKRKDSDRWNAAVDRIEAKFGLRFDRAISGGKTKTKSTRKKHNCSPKSQQCGTVCIPLTKECRDGSVGSAQERLKKLKRSGADDLQVQRAKTSIKTRTTGKRSELAEKRIGVLRDRVKNSALSGARKAEGLAELDPNTIEVDPKRFQYKIIGEHTATGSVGSLSGVRKYDPNLAGILQVWKDPANGKTYVVNGHNRLDLGKKLGAESVAVRYLKAPDAKTARAIGALTNIAEGRGDALDAAKFFRDTGISKEDLSAKGIPMREKIATDGLALSKLDDSLFRRTIDGDIPMARAAIVGGSGLDAASQRDLMKLVDKEGKKKNLTDGAISEMVDIAKSSQTSQKMTLSLFGEEMVTKSNMIEKAKLQASIKQRLSREKNLFGTVSRGRAADELARGGNTIDKSKSGEISSNADRTLKQFDQMKNLSGPMSDAINRAATRMSNGESQKSVEKDLYAEISTIDIFGNRQRLAA